MAAKSNVLKSVKKETAKKYLNCFFMFSVTNKAANKENKQQTSSMTVPFLLKTVEWKIRNEKLPEGTFILQDA